MTASSYSESLGESRYFPVTSQKTAPLKIGDFAIPFLIGAVTPGQPSGIRGDGGELSARRRVAVPLWRSACPLGISGMQAMRYSTTNRFGICFRESDLVACFVFVVVLCVCVFLFQQIYSRLFFRDISPKLGPAGGTALDS